MNVKLVLWYILCSIPLLICFWVGVSVKDSGPASVSVDELIGALWLWLAMIISIICLFTNLIFLRKSPKFINERNDAIQGAIISFIPLLIAPWVLS